jgi:hypothetical protein
VSAFEHLLLPPKVLEPIGRQFGVAAPYAACSCALGRPARRAYRGPCWPAQSHRRAAACGGERIAAGNHRVAILEFDEAGIHRAAHEDEAKLAFAAMPIPPVDVRLAPQEVAPFPVFTNMNMRPKDEQRLPTDGTRFNLMCGRQATRPPSTSPPYRAHAFHF